MSQPTPPPKGPSEAYPPSSAPYPDAPGAYPPSSAPYPGAPGAYQGAPGPYPGAPGAYQGAPGPYPGAPAAYPGAPGPYPGASQMQDPVGGKSFLVTWLLSLLVGVLGVDRFYLGKIGTGIAKLLTFGGLGIWALVDLVLILTNKQTDKQGRRLEGYDKHKVVALIVTAVFVIGSIAINSSRGAAAPVSAPTPSATQAAPAAAAAPAAEPAATQAPGATGKKVGAPFTADMGNGNVATITILSATYSDAVTTGPYASPAKNGGFLILDVLWETSKGETSSNPMYFKAKDADGRSANVELFADDQIGSGEIPVGDKARGKVAFDIKAGTSTVIITTPLLQEAARVQVTP
jgi:TM2 domain/Domain of unknown function (DUF4352)